MSNENSNAPASSDTAVIAEGTINTEGSAPAASELLGQAVEAASAAIEAPGKTPKDAEPAPAAQTAEQDRLARQFASLTRKEQALRQREMALKQQAHELQQRITALEQQYKSKEQELSTKMIDPVRFKREPLKVMQETGLTFEQLAEIVVNNGKPTAEMLLAEKEAEINKKIQELEQKLAQKEQQEQEAKYEQTIQNFKAELVNFVNTNNDYELIRANDAVDLVYDVIEEHHANTGEILSTKDASDAVEQYLLEQVKKQLELNKIKGLNAPKVQPASPPAQATRQAAPTLSNAAATTAPKTGAKKLSVEESIAEAAKLIRWDA